jgi:DNA-binding response OmpR family regulator
MEDVQMRVLVLDDEPSIRFSLASYLEDYNFDVLQASSSEEALDLLEVENCQLAIVDLRLPGKSGESFIQQAAIAFPHMKYLIYTGSTEYILSEDVKKLGVTKDDIFYKPQPDLQKIINRVKQKLGY